MQINIVNGIFTDADSDFRTSYPVNLIPVPKSQGISEGYLRPAEGIVQLGEGPGKCRGGIVWEGVAYRVMGTDLVKVAEDGVVTVIGEIGGTGPCSMTYSFDYLAIASDGELWLYNGNSLAQNVDADLGDVLDVVWVDGYFMTTDGSFLVVTELGDPFSVNPLKYGSSEVDPDPVVAVLKFRNEIYALNANTIEVFSNVGGGNFPFQRIEGAQIEKGVVGTHACAVFIGEGIAFVGGGRNEAPAVWVGAAGSAIKVSTREIDEILSGYTSDQLSQIVVESRLYLNHNHLIIHLPDQALIYDLAASNAISQPVWFKLTSSVDLSGPWAARYILRLNDKWVTGDPTSGRVGYLTDAISSHWGDVVSWEFGTQITYNEGNGAIIHRLELVALSGRVEVGASPMIMGQYSDDGLEWSQPFSVKAGTLGERKKRIVWLQQGAMSNWRIQRFRGDSTCHASFARLEAALEPLAW